MLIRTILILMLLFGIITNSVFAQKVQIGEVNNSTNTNIQPNVKKIIKDKKGNIYVVTFSRNITLSGVLTIQKFDSATLKLIDEKNIDKPGKGMRILHKVDIKEDRILLTVGASQILKGKTTMYLQEVETSSLELIETKEIYDIKIGGKLKKFFYAPVEYEGQLVWGNENTHRYVYILPSLEKKSSTFSILQIQMGGNTEYEGSIELPAMPFGIRVGCVYLDETTGNIYTIIHAYANKDKTKQDNYIISYIKDKNDLSFNKIKNLDNNIKINTIDKDTESQKVVVSGFYTNKEDKKFKGVFSFSVDDYENIKLMPSNELEGKIDNLEEFLAKNIYTDSEGNTIYINEKYETITKTTTKTEIGTGKSNSSSEYYTHFKDVVIYKLDKSGDLLWTKHIKKSQYLHAGVSFLGSIVTAFKEGKLYIYTASSNKNDKNEILLTTTSADGAELIEFIIDKNGTLSEKVVLESQKIKDLDIYLTPYFSTQTSDNEVIIPCWKKNEHLLLRIYLDK